MAIVNITMMVVMTWWWWHGDDMVMMTTWWRRPVPASSSQPQSWCEWRPCRRTADPVIELFISIWIRLLGSLSIRQTIVILYARFSDSNTTSFISFTSLPVLLVHIKAPVRSRLEEIFPESWICREGSAGWLGCWKNLHTHPCTNCGLVKLLKCNMNSWMS